MLQGAMLVIASKSPHVQIQQQNRKRFSMAGRGRVKKA